MRAVHRSLPVLLAGFLCLAPGACSGPEVYEGDIIRGGDQVTVEVRSFVDELEVDDVVGRFDEATGRAAAQFRLYNDEDEPLYLRITWAWLDLDGLRLRTAVDERPRLDIVLEPDEEFLFTKTAPTGAAHRLEVRIESLATGQD